MGGTVLSVTCRSISVIWKSAAHQGSSRLGERGQYCNRFISLTLWYLLGITGYVLIEMKSMSYWIANFGAFHESFKIMCIVNHIGCFLTTCRQHLKSSNMREYKTEIDVTDRQCLNWPVYYLLHNEHQSILQYRYSWIRWLDLHMYHR